MATWTTEIDAFCDTLRAQALFEPGAALAVSRAPGRLDVMGGIADYSGSLVLQRPIAEATLAAVQRIQRPVLEVLSLGRPPCTIPLAALAPGGVPVGYDEARRMFGDGSGGRGPAEADQGPAEAGRYVGGRDAGRPAEAGHYAEGRYEVVAPHWMSYVAGPVLVLARECGMPLNSGVRIVVQSAVPEGKGVSSSAAIETASMHATAAAFGIALEPRDLALLCQKSENLISGAPCGVMDQMTCVFGEPGALLALLCQPAELQLSVPVPDDIGFWGLDSGERHAVGGSDYGAVRAGAFMGLQIVTARAGMPVDYLANIDPLDFEQNLGRFLPEEVSGDEFLSQYGSTADTVTRVERGRRYRVRAPAAHPVYERQRAESFRRLLRTSPGEERRVRLGALMYESHASYVACGLGSPGTDRLVELVRSAGPEAGLYGARITGGGSGGTVAVIGRTDASAEIVRVAGMYADATGYRPHVFSGSSPGVLAFGAQSIVL